MTEICVTASGLVTGLGTGVDALWEGLSNGRPAPVRERTRPEQPPMRGVTVEGFTDRSSMVGAAVSEALAQGGMEVFPDTGWVLRVGQTARGGGGSTAAGPPARPHPSVPNGARSLLLSHACASVMFAVHMARDLLTSGTASAVLIVGGFLLNRDEYFGMEVSRALSPTQRARPFSSERDGTVLGEGAGALLLETRERSEARGHAPLAVLSGVATRLVPSTTASDAKAVLECVRAAVGDAGEPVIDVVHAHASGTVQGDACELAALDQAAEELRWGRPLVSSHKGLVGHLMHTAALPGVVSALLAIRHRTGFGTPGVHLPPPTRRVRVVGGAEPLPAASTHLVTGLGFGGNNGALVLTSA